MSNNQGVPIINICDACERGIPEGSAYDGPTGTDWEGAILCAECHKEIIEDIAAYHGVELENDEDCEPS